MKSLLAEANTSDQSVENKTKSLSINGAEAGLQASIEKAQRDLHKALSDSFDTPQALRVIGELIKEANIHMGERQSNLDIVGLENAARWITKICGIFGLDSNAEPPYDGLGWATTTANSNLTPEKILEPYVDVYQKVQAEVKRLDVHSEVLDQLLSADVQTEAQPAIASGSKDPEVIAMPYLRAISRARDELRKLAPASASKKDILALSDEIRDTDLTLLGVYLDDRSDGLPSLIKFVPKEELMAAREEKIAKEKEKQAQKEAARLAREKLEAEKAEKAKLSPKDMYKNDERFSAWNDDGMPTKTKEGEDVPKSALKKLKKDFDRQAKLHEEYLAKQK